MADEKKEKGNLHLLTSSLVQAEFVITRWVASVPACDKSRLADPSYWAHVARKLKPYSHIEVHAEDMSFWCELLVIASGQGWVKVKCINACDIEVPAENEADLLEGFAVSFKGPMKGHTVLRLSDMRVIKEGLPSRNDAVQFVVNHKTSIAA